MAAKVKGVKRQAEESAVENGKRTKVTQNGQDNEDESSQESSGDELSEQSSGDNSDSSGDELDNVESEEDDLDNLSEGEQDNESDDGSDDGSDKASSKDPVDDANKKTSKEQHAEQRKLLSERKLSRKSGIEVKEIKKLWERLRVNKPTPPKQVRDKLCDEIWNLSKDVILDLVMKHDASRVVQTLVKYSSKERRESVVQQLKGSYYQLATSSYGKYLLVKLLHYGSKESRGLIVNELHGKLRKLMRHKEGAYVVEDLFVLYSNAEQKQQMIREFWGAEYAVFKESGYGKSILDIVNELSEKKQVVMSNLNGTITASVEKGSTGFQILHAAMKEYVTVLMSNIDEFDSQIRDFEDLLGEQFAELVHTPEGCEVACNLIAVANAKERKVIIRALKQHATDLIKNEHGNLVLITLFMTVDDTVLLNKSFIIDLFTPEFIPELIQGKFSRRPLLYLLNGLDGKYFNPLVKKDLTHYEDLAYKKTSKKPQQQRRLELLDKALPVIIKGLVNEKDSTPMDQLLTVNLGAQTITEVILTPSESSEVNDELRPQLIDAVYKVTVEGDVLEDFHLLNKTPFISRSIKSLIHGKEFKFDNEQKRLVISDSEVKIPGTGKEFAERVYNEIINNDKLSQWASGQGSFIILAIYEVFEALKDIEKSKQLKKELKKIKKQLSQDKDNKGALILLKLLN